MLFFLETLQRLGHIVSRIFGCIPGGCVFLLLCIRRVFVMFTNFILMVHGVIFRIPAFQPGGPGSIPAQGRIYGGGQTRPNPLQKA